MKDPRALLEKLWNDYTALNRRAAGVYDLLVSRGETVVNDHIALRTFGHRRVGVDVLAAAFTSVGYQAKATYDFTEKKLAARHYEHPDVSLPKVFISELQLEAFSPALRKRVDRFVQQVPDDWAGRWDLPVSGRPWSLSYQDYETLGGESEYAAWVAAWGFHVNHFTVLVNGLKGFTDLAAFNRFVKDAGYALNTSGGEIKGSAAVCLEQSSTLAEHVNVEFSDGTHAIPCCYYEFARRYPLPDGALFQGFVAKSADKIFESTDRQDQNP